MNAIDHFKLQAKNLFRDYKTKTPYIDDVDGNTYYKYDPKYFDVDSIVFDFEIDEDDFSLMKAQHIIARIAGFEKWAELLTASEAKLELAKLLLNNLDIIHPQSWKDYIAEAEEMNQTSFDDGTKLEMYKELFLNRRIFEDSFPDYLLNKRKG